MSFSKSSSKLLLLSSAIVVVQISPAFADIKDDRILALEKQLQILAVEIQALKSEQVEERQNIAKAVQQAEEAINIAKKSRPANATSAVSNNDIEVSMKGSMPTFRSGVFSFQPTGRIHVDGSAFDDDNADHPNGGTIRRARIGFNGTLPHDLVYRLAVDFGNEEVSLKDAFIGYNVIEGTQIRAGDFKPGFMLEEMISSNDMTFIERVPVLNAFTNARRIGVAFDTHGENWTTEAGIFGAQAGTQSEDDEQWSVAGRSTFSPILKDRSTLHLGGSWSYRVPDQANDTFDFDAKANNSLQKTDSVAAVITDAESAKIYTLEAARTIGPLAIQGEYLVADVDRKTNSSASLHGGYGQISWFATGESRAYSVTDGAYKNPKITRPLNPSKGDWGSLELAARYAYLDLNDGTVAGGEITTTDLGMNWYLNDNTRLMGNMIFTNTDENAVTPDDDPTLLLLRAQVDF